eukprot:TRINITY_DN25159_c0_g1_i1.p1 TRINITY_DN25159_c0_g1~~TRINITY_DN25159_c0_g1_i1.p1  ORF type:complete len:422 (-),score=111.59 TRINITY_DN25159_c0_g1_i1:123-1388(-)
MINRPRPETRKNAAEDKSTGSESRKKKHRTQCQKSRARPQAKAPEQAAPKKPVRRSVYLHGSVGTGKTMLLDMFFKEVGKTGLRTIRRHFYEFMIGFHAQMNDVAEERPVEVVANTLADNVDVLCFDEFQITDIQDAAILPRLFEILFLRGVVVVLTSNTSPQLLYAGGLNRHVHLPAFVNLLGEHCTVLGLGTAPAAGSQKTVVDYRKRAEAEEAAQRGDGAAFADEVYFCGDAASERLAAWWQARLASSPSPSATPRVIALSMGRSMQIAEAASGACLVDFAEICGRERGELDFLALAKNFQTIGLRGVPKFASLQEHDDVRRFVKLLDVLYDRRVRLVVAAAAPPAELFEGIRQDIAGSDVGDLAWRTAMYSADGKSGMSPSASGTVFEAIRATERAESRLREMRTRKYWDGCAAGTS